MIRCLAAAQQQRRGAGAAKCPNGSGSARRHLLQWRQHEPALGVTGVRQRQLGARDHDVVVEQHIYVERARSPMHEALPQGLGLDTLAATQEGERVERRIHNDHHVEERSLAVRATDRLGLVELRGSGDDPDLADSVAQERLAVSDVRTQGDDRPVRGLGPDVAKILT